MFLLSKTHSLILIVCTILLFLYKIETGTQSVSVISYEFKNIKHCELFRLLTNPDIVHLWFKWIRHFRSADQKPLEIGKSFYVYFDNDPLLFEVIKYTPNELITLKSESFFKPVFKLKTVYVSEDKTRLMISIMFRRSSALFQFSLGAFLQNLSKKKLSRAIKDIKAILNNNPKLFHLYKTNNYC